MNIEVLIPNGVVGSGPTRSAASDASAGAVIREGHQGLVEAFREFARDVDGMEDSLPDPDVLRAAIAFLRQSLLPNPRQSRSRPDGSALLNGSGNCRPTGPLRKCRCGRRGNPSPR